MTEEEKTNLWIEIEKAVRASMVAGGAELDEINQRTAVIWEAFDRACKHLPEKHTGRRWSHASASHPED